MHRSFVSTLAIAAALWGGEASAQCVPNNPANGATVVCGGEDTNGFVFDNRNGITLTVEDGAKVTNAAGLRGIHLRDNAKINVDGTVSTTDNDAIRVRDNGTVVVSVTGTVTGTGPEADGVQGRDGLELTVEGTISVGKEGVNAGNDANITVEATGTIEALDDAIGAAEAVTILNLGRIANIQTQAMIDAGDEAQDGLDIDSGDIVNGDFANTTAEISATFGDAIDFDPPENDAPNNRPTESSITNYGLIKGGNRAVETDPGNTDAQIVQNFGRIIGGSGLAMNLGAGDDEYVHDAGATLEGGIDFGTGNDVLAIFGRPNDPLGGPGALMNGGAGMDLAIFDGFMFDEIAGIFDGSTLDLTFGNGPDLFSVRLRSFETFFFADSDGNGVSFETVLTQVGIVPLPAPALLLIGGLGAMAMMRRRRAAA